MARFKLLSVLAAFVVATACRGSMVGMVVGRSGRVVVEKPAGRFAVDGFIRVDVGDGLQTTEEGGQLLLFDNTRAHLLPGSTYRVGRSGVFKRLAHGCVLAHQYRQAYGGDEVTGGAVATARAVGALRLAREAYVLRPGQGWTAVGDDTPVCVNDFVHVRDCGGVRLELASGAVCHLTGPAQAYVNGAGVELEVGRMLVNAASVQDGVNIGTPTADVERARTLFGLAVADGLTRVRTYGGRLQLSNRYGRRRETTTLSGVCQGTVDGRGDVARTQELVSAEAARDVVAQVLEALNDARPDGYHERIARATEALGNAVAQARTHVELARLTPEVGSSERDADEEPNVTASTDDWKSEVEGYFDNHRSAGNAVTPVDDGGGAANDEPLDGGGTSSDDVVDRARDEWQPTPVLTGEPDRKPSTANNAAVEPATTTNTRTVTPATTRTKTRTGATVRSSTRATTTAADAANVKLVDFEFR